MTVLVAQKSATTQTSLPKVATVTTSTTKPPPNPTKKPASIDLYRLMGGGILPHPKTQS